MKLTNNLHVALVVGALVGLFPIGLHGAETTTKPPASQTKPSTSPSVPRADRVDINTASADKIKAIKGLNEEQAKKIIDGRPYKRRGDLVTKKVLTQEAYDKIKDQITARAPGTTKTN